MERTIADQLLARQGDRKAGLRTRERTWSWDEVVQESAARAAIAREFRADGPFHIGVLLENVPEHIFWLGGAALAGATIAGINPTHRGADLEAQVRHVDCQLIITDRTGWDRLAGLDIGVPPERFLLVDEPGYGELVTAHAEPPHAHDGVDESALFLLLFTSGTTGTSKAARCTQGRLTRLGYATGEKYGVTADDVCYCCMPLFHGNALMALWAPALAAGCTVCLTPKFSASRFIDDVRYFGITYFTYVGKSIAYLLATPERDDDGDNTLTHAFGTEASPEDQAEFARRFDCVLQEGYGSSEGSGHVRNDPDAPPDSLGKPSSEAVAVVDPDTLGTCPPARLDEYGRLRNPGEAIGEIVDKAAAARFEGYYKNETADAQRVRNGWYWTGDLGYLDERGFLYFAGRQGDWIRVDGENFSALLVERVLRRHPDVVLAAAFAVPDPRTGDRAMAAVELRGGAEFDPVEFAGFLSAQPDLGIKAVPRFLRVSTGLPTTGSDKLRKNVLRERAWRCADRVYWWTGRGGPDYSLMSDEDKSALEAEFAAHGRQRVLPADS
ncbi:AMP-binding protein [Saccharopolyspora sp. SCSIO 74807]|uniref:AMP-binding protein n=1 Tax=Saccharopolyspora sp. SCSIO 74807 TaxID=3118084 RepID=UPI0030CFE0C4